MDTVRAAATSHVAFAIQRLGAQLGPAVFVLPDGRQVSPLHVAPWADDPGRRRTPRHPAQLARRMALRALRIWHRD